MYACFDKERQKSHQFKGRLNMGKYTTKFLQKIIDYYQPVNKGKLTMDDAREIADMFVALGKWRLKVACSATIIIPC